MIVKKTKLKNQGIAILAYGHLFLLKLLLDLIFLKKKEEEETKKLPSHQFLSTPCLP